MKVFVADSRKKGNISDTDYHWCDDNDLLMFGQFQMGNGNPLEVSMCGIQSRKFTTHSFVKDMQIDRDYYKELISESTESSMNCEIGKDGKYTVIMGKEFTFNINDQIEELLEKASHFKDGEKVKCFGRTLTSASNTF